MILQLRPSRMYVLQYSKI
ncbi:Protein of unknown function [Pyronema omphalodes CBS 100304]|uniref:Uncharacterized protein n=1 Tax=Pyronema omphalodes (strain CBS 100304) TaxID=1076935 RepID=U4LTB3_PYROM|nr:Protein of unknown function [Pyronema omphalodes CBS 100304]